MYAMNIQNDVIVLVLRENCKSKQMTEQMSRYDTKKGALDSQPQVIKFTSYLLRVCGSLRLPPPLKLVAMI